MKYDGQIEYILLPDGKIVYTLDQNYYEYLDQWLKNLPNTYNWKLVIEKI